MSKLFSTIFKGLSLIAILAGLFLYLKFPQSLYLKLVEFSSNLLKSKFSSRGTITKIELALHTVGLLLVVLPLVVVAFTKSLAWLLNKTKGKFENASPNLKTENVKLTSTDWTIIAVVTCIGAILRIIPINNSLWGDEIGVYDTFIKPGVMASIIPVSSLGSHPLMQIIVALFTKIVGVSGITLRLPSLFIAILSIPLFYVVLIKLTGKRLMATIGSVLLMLHSYHIYYSYQLRGYTLLVFLSIISIYLLIKLVSNPNKKTALYLGLINMLLLYTHIFALYFIIAQGITLALLLLYQLYSQKIESPLINYSAAEYIYQSIVFTLAASAILYLPSVPVLLMTLISPPDQEPISLLSHMISCIQGFPYFFSDSVHLYACMTGLLLVIAGFFTILKKNVMNIILFILFLTYTLILLFMKAGGGGLQVRYMIIGVPLFLVLFSILLYEVSKKQMGYRIFGLLLFGGFIFISVAALPDVYKPVQNFKGAVEYVHLHAHKTKPLVIVANSLGKYEVGFYDKNIIPLQNVRQLDSLMALPVDLFAITTHKDLLGTTFFLNDKVTQDTIESAFEHTLSFPGEADYGMTDVNVWHYIRK